MQSKQSPLFEVRSPLTCFGIKEQDALKPTALILAGPEHKITRLWEKNRAPASMNILIQVGKEPIPSDKMKKNRPARFKTY